MKHHAQSLDLPFVAPVDFRLAQQDSAPDFERRKSEAEAKERERGAAPEKQEELL